MTKHHSRTLGNVVVAMIAALLASMALAQDPASTPARKADSKTELRVAMRKLWEDHLTYTRNYIISALASLPDADAVVQRLMKNQDDIGAALKTYYGNDAGNKLATLLRDHIKIAAGVVQAAKDGKKDDLKAEQKKWSENGKAIAGFLSAANPKWSGASLGEMLQKHLDLTSAEVVARLQKDWTADIKAYDAGHEHMLLFSGMLSDGIAQQFPDKFEP